ncbi:hypothetical protein ABKN59_011648 [Abortiporus biennis]
MSMARRNETKSGLLESVVVMREQLWKERETNARSAKSRWPSISDLEYARKHLRTMGYISSTRLEIIRRSIDKIVVEYKQIDCAGSNQYRLVRDHTQAWVLQKAPNSEGFFKYVAARSQANWERKGNIAMHRVAIKTKLLNVL